MLFQQAPTFSMRVMLGADHRGFALKEDLKMFLEAAGYNVDDVGAHSLDSSDDYPDFAHMVGAKVASEKESRGIVVCGSGEGVCVVANKVPGIRAAAAYSTDLAQSAREHLDANVLTLSADATDQDTARAITLTFLTTDFSGEERHLRRIEKIQKIEEHYGNTSRTNS